MHWLCLFSFEERISLDQTRAEQQEEEIGPAEDYQALSTKEEADLERMMNECEYAIGNAEAFVERLANDLSVLDGVCELVFTSLDGGFSDNTIVHDLGDFLVQ